MNQQRSNSINSNTFRNSSNVLTSGSGPQIVGTNVQSIPPPVPPRRPNSSYTGYNNYSGIGSSYLGGGIGGGYGMGSSLGYRGYGGYGGYSSLGSYGSYGGGGYGSYGYPPYNGGQFVAPSGDVENRFVQYAEESTRPAFQSIEAMVHTFSSVTMMLESTFFAMTSSFRAILGVADNMGKLRAMFGQMLSSFALVRFLKWLYWRAKRLLGLRGHDPNDESAWEQTVSEVMSGTGTEPTPSTWPIFMFLSLLVAAPYLVHKLVSSTKNPNFQVSADNPKDWVKYNEPLYTATALYDFVASSSEELSLKTGQKLWLAPQALQPKNLPGWWKATDSINVGLIPATYVTIVGQLKKKPESNPIISEPVPEEIAQDLSATTIGIPKEKPDDCNLETDQQQKPCENREIQEKNEEIFQQ
ncbi:probable peroxisomal membrane protein PEX13 [Belonocnema kinseyi]|uniref:probable peroxisomal membrane protein PEX13 n=1 Tax=Belonocnema kinseyi TaxID=2817044 RepID=UPI00143DE599|nr:probable peroxisomal membrane protein PEX13 [Belonocnema kinseyi]